MKVMEDTAMRLRGYLAADPSNALLASELADIYIRQGRTADAAILLEQLPELARDSDAVQSRIGRLALLRGDYPAAEAVFASLLAHGTSAESLMHDLAFAQLCQRHTQQAKETIDQAIGHFGLTPALGVLKARILMMGEDYDSALATLDKVLEQQPDSAEAQGVKALALFDADRMEECASVAGDCLKQHPHQHEALLVAGTLMLWAQRADQAASLLETALEVQPNSGRVLSGYGQTLMLHNRLDEARKVLEHAVEAMPDHIGTWHALAWAQLLQGDQAAAERSYRAAYELDRNFGDTHGGLALIDASHGRFDAAEMGVKRALRLDPNAVTAKYAQALVLEAKGDVAGSETLMETLVEGTGSTVPAQVFSGQLKTLLRARTRD